MSIFCFVPPQQQIAGVASMSHFLKNKYVYAFVIEKNYCEKSNYLLFESIFLFKASRVFVNYAHFWNQ